MNAIYPEKCVSHLSAHPKCDICQIIRLRAMVEGSDALFMRITQRDGDDINAIAEAMADDANEGLKLIREDGPEPYEIEERRVDREALKHFRKIMLALDGLSGPEGDLHAIAPGPEEQELQEAYAAAKEAGL